MITVYIIKPLINCEDLIDITNVFFTIDLAKNGIKIISLVQTHGRRQHNYYNCHIYQKSI